jgi:4-amino-4-deoxy-L-arabinose transferase-like glycosyltransferase
MTLVSWFGNATHVHERPCKDRDTMTVSVSETIKRSWAPAVILVLFLGVSVLYNVSTPIYEAPDELEHMAFVVWLADGQGLPVVSSQLLGPWKQEGTQPPLYYWALAALVGGLSHGAADGLADLNPYAGIGDPQRPDNKNRVLHDVQQESWPYQGGALSVHLARGVSTLMAVGTLLAVYCLGRSVFPTQPGIALGMMGFVAFMPQFLFLSASVNNDNLVILLATWVLVLLVIWLRTPRLPGWLSLFGMGVLLGLAVLAKYGGLLLWPLVGGVLFWLAWREKRFRWLVPSGLIVFGLALVLCGWWFVRNQQLYGDLSGLNVHLAIMGTRQRLPSIPAALRELRGFWYSFWALFGWFNILVPKPFYWIMDALAVLGLVGLGLFLIRSFRQIPPWTRQALVLLAAWLGLVAIGFLRWTIWTPASQGRLLYPALGAIALFLVVGWAHLVPRRLHRPVGVVALVGWAAWAILSPLLFIKPAYALPERVAALDQANLDLSELHVRFGQCCELVGYVLPAQGVYPGDRVPLTLVWRALETTDQNYSLYVHATTVDGQVLGQLDTFHGGGAYPTGQWRSGEFIIDTEYVPISWRATGPALLRFNVGLHAGPGPERLPAFTANGQELEAIFAGEVPLLPFQWPEPQTSFPVGAAFGQKIELTGASFSQTEAQPGEVVTITLQWRSLAGIEEDYTGFVHLVDPAGNDVAQDDHFPTNGLFPTRVWSSGTVVSDTYRIELPGNLAAGDYALWAGLYQPQSGQRLEAISQETGERWKDDLVYLGTLAIKAGDR